MAALMRDRFHDPTIPFNSFNAPELSIKGRCVVPSNVARDSVNKLQHCLDMVVSKKFYFVCIKETCGLYSDISEQMIYMLTNNKGLSGFRFRHNQEEWQCIRLP